MAHQELSSDGDDVTEGSYENSYSDDPYSEDDSSWEGPVRPMQVSRWRMGERRGEERIEGRGGNSKSEASPLSSCLPFILCAPAPQAETLVGCPSLCCKPGTSNPKPTSVLAITPDPKPLNPCHQPRP